MAQLSQSFLGSFCSLFLQGLPASAIKEKFVPAALLCPPLPRSQNTGPGHKEKGFVSLSVDIIYSCHPNFKAKGPPLGALVLGQGLSDLGPGGAGGEQAGEGSRGVTGWPVSLGRQCCLALAGAELIGLLSGPCGLL